jgi:hypothetical protein
LIRPIRYQAVDLVVALALAVALAVDAPTSLADAVSCGMTDAATEDDWW